MQSKFNAVCVEKIKRGKHSQNISNS